MVGSTGSRLLVTLSVWFVAGGAVLVQSWSYYWTTGLIAGAALIFAFIVTLALWAPFVFPWIVQIGPYAREDLTYITYTTDDAPVSGFNYTGLRDSRDSRMRGR